ncbi:hypothetical protein Tco_0942688, partial [Tanacetum coccineum]
HIALNLNDEALDSEDVEVQKIRPIGRDRAKKKGSSSASRSSSSVAVDPNLVDTLLSKFRKVLTPLFSSRKESSSEHLRIKERWCQLDFPVISNIAEWFSWLDSAHLSKYARSNLEGIASTMLWSIWNFRNAWIFSNSKPKKANIWDSVVHQSFLWISSRNPKCRFRWIDWLRNPIETHM